MDHVDRLMRGMRFAFGIWAPRTAYAVGVLWWATDYSPSVVVLGFTVVPAVRLLLDQPLLVAAETAQAHRSGPIGARRD
jgi:hypothetical protein